MNSQLVIICSVGTAIGLMTYALCGLMVRPQARLRQRLNTQGGRGRDQSEQLGGPRARGLVAGGVGIVQKVGQAAAKPFLPSNREKESSLRRELGYAGIYSPVAFKLIIGSKVILLGAGMVCGYFAGIFVDQMLLGISLGGLAGYLAPMLWLKSQQKANQQYLACALPDALDLMVVCVEAGLTIDAAMQRIGQELALAHPRLSRELAIAHMETRVGLSRADALRNLGQRTGSPAIQSLVAMLIQADRFGTSIASALRIHAESLRQARQTAAEEMAAKASVKMSFPLVLFIFPATFIVLAGPTIIGLFNSELMK